MIKIFLVIAFLVFTVIGSISRIKDTRKLRAHRNYKNMLVAWAENPRFEFRDDIHMGISIYSHWASTVLIGIVTIIIIIINPLNVSWHSALSIPILFLLLINTGFLWGANLLHPIINLNSGERHYALAVEGILFGNNLFPWNTFSGFSIDERKEIIVWSSSMPETVCFTFKPQTYEKMLEIIEILQRNLFKFASPPQNVLKRCVISTLMIFFSIPFVALSIVSLLLPTVIAVIINNLLLYLLMKFGAKLLLKYVYGNNLQPAFIEE